LFVVHDSIQRFNLGACAAFAAFVVVVTITTEDAFLKSRTGDVGPYTVHIILTLVQLAVAFFSLIAFLTLQRRPAVFHDGQPVDGELTVSALSRFSFSWGSPVLKFARKNKALGFDDLPRVSQYLRSNFLQGTFNERKSRSRLWKQVFYYFRWAFFQQFVLIITIGVTQFGPQFAMFNLLKLLEQRAQGDQVAAVAWAWVFGLGFFMLGSSLFESWLFWIVYARLGVPIRAMLSVLVFMKATRRKDVKGVQKADVAAAEDAKTSHGPAVNESSGHKGGDTASGAKKDDADDDEESMQKSRQSTINLVGVDSKRVSDFACYAYIFPGVVTKLTVSMCFLYTLIGGKALLAGLLTFALSVPFNIFVSKRYNALQGDLMKLRDQKMAVVTEALQGIRQIKFSALERQWQAKIGVKRSQELAVLWKIWQYETALISLWIFGPVMLSAVSLTVYSYIHGDLSPSIAFTTIAIFSQIEGTLAIVPELTTEALDAWVSINRIEKYLDAPEKVDCTVPSDAVSFENASIAWPSDSQEEDADRFILKDINLRFPNKQLSVISGKTGSGKSLLLAAILGEVDKISGVIKVPKAPLLQDRFDHQATKGDWIIDSAIAFVAQIPWIENATIKDNVLFGLPFDAGRYKKVVSVCALEKDLEMLEDGELTEIGANGINLSGGQRWRVSFARALYSRAGILVLDDIFSALDAHVGRQLFEEALTGELGVGRTRILVTHHVGLCLPRSNYTVLLGEGTVEHAGFVEDLQRTGSLEQILQQEKSEVKEVLEDDDLLNVDEPDGDVLTRVLSKRSAHSALVDDGGADKKPKPQPKKFTEDEKRETGSIKFDLYKEYISTSGGIKLWGPLCVLFVGYMGLILGRVSDGPPVASYLHSSLT
jgi:ABC-type multidrug transport system fused ATPase/permease subunit